MKTRFKELQYSREINIQWKETPILESRQISSLLPYSSEGDPHSERWTHFQTWGQETSSWDRTPGVGQSLGKKGRDTWAAPGMDSGSPTPPSCEHGSAPSSRLPFIRTVRKLSLIRLKFWPQMRSPIHKPFGDGTPDLHRLSQCAQIILGMQTPT